MKIQKIVRTLVLAVVCIAAPAAALQPVSSADHIIGNPNADVVVVLFSDIDCPYSKMFQSTMHNIVDNYDGRVAWVYRNFPLDSLHPDAREKAEAAECVASLAGNGTYWDFVDELYSGVEDLDDLEGIAAEFGVNRNAFNVCVASGQFAARVQAHFDDALASGGHGTPYSVLVARSGQMISVNGAQSYEVMRQNIDQMLPLFADGFNDGTMCAWSSSACVVPTFINDDASVVNGSTAEYGIDWTLENINNSVVFQSKVMCRGLNSVNCGTSFTIRKADGTVYTGGVTAVQLSASNSALDSPTHWGMAGNGADRPFWAFIALNNANGTIGSYRARVEGISYAFDGNDMVGDRLLTMNYQTDLVNVLNVQPLGDQTEALLDALPYRVWTPGVETFIETSPGIFQRITY